MGTVSRGLRAVLSSSSTSRISPIASTSLRPIASLQSSRSSAISLRLVSTRTSARTLKQDEQLSNRTSNRNIATTQSSSSPALKTLTQNTGSPSPTSQAPSTSAAAPATTSKASMATVAAPSPDSYVIEGTEPLDPSQPRIILADPARGRWTLPGTHAYAIALLANITLFAFIIMDFINDWWTLWGLVVMEQLGR